MCHSPATVVEQHILSYGLDVVNDTCSQNQPELVPIKQMAWGCDSQAKGPAGKGPGDDVKCPGLSCKVLLSVSVWGVRLLLGQPATLLLVGVRGPSRPHGPAGSKETQRWECSWASDRGGVDPAICGPGSALSGCLAESLLFPLDGVERWLPPACASRVTFWLQGALSLCVCFPAPVWKGTLSVLPPGLAWIYYQTVCGTSKAFWWTEMWNLEVRKAFAAYGNVSI